ncbi:MAG: hypothetical protein V2B18_06115 [Pseudomonadota bacterium]
MTEIGSRVYPVLHEDDTATRLGSKTDDVFIEVRKERIPRPLENLAIHYRTFFPSGEIIKPGDAEEYVKVNGRNAYKVVFAPKYVRHRERVPTDAPTDSTKPGWTRKKTTDPESGETIEAVYSPVMPRYRVLYLVEGDRYIYYIFMRADGPAAESAKEALNKLVYQGIKYR